MQIQLSYCYLKTPKYFKILSPIWYCTWKLWLVSQLRKIIPCVSIPNTSGSGTLLYIPEISRCVSFDIFITLFTFWIVSASKPERLIWHCSTMWCHSFPSPGEPKYFFNALKFLKPFPQLGSPGDGVLLDADCCTASEIVLALSPACWISCWSALGTSLKNLAILSIPMRSI